MKKLSFILSLFIMGIPVLGQEYQTTIYKHFTKGDMDSLNIIINDIEKHNPNNKNRYLSYWNAYARYNHSLILSETGQKKQAEQELNRAKKLLENIDEKTSEDYALLGMCYNYNISFANFLKIPALSSKAKKMAQEAIKLDDKNIRAYLVLGINDFYTPKMYGGQKKCEEYLISSVTLEEKTSRNSYDPSWGKNDGYYYLISYYLEIGERDKAAERLMEAIKIYPNDNRLKNLIKQ